MRYSLPPANGTARELAWHFEQVRAFFLDAMGWGLKSGPPVRIVAFRSEKEYKPYAPNEVAAAFYLGADDRDYIVTRSASADAFPISVHEYTHLLVKHSGRQPPTWFNEGLADSPLINEKSHAGLFYAECWALMHMFYLDSACRPQLKALLENVNAATDMDAVF